MMTVNPEEFLGKHRGAREQSKPRAKTAPNGSDHSEPPKSLWCDDCAWDEAEIPTRRWIAPGYLLRGAVTLIAGAPGVSKSSIACCYAVALALGRPFHRFEPVRPIRVIIYNVEDDQYEQRRRLSAALRSYGKTPADIAGQVRRIGPNGVGTLFAVAEAGKIIETDAWAELVKHIEEFRPDVLFLDPFVELHDVSENDNGQVRNVMARLRALAVKFELALVIVHHSRKGPQAAGDPDGARGASAIIGAARIALTTTAMQPEEALAFGLTDEQRRHLFRIDGSKSNYAALIAAEWFQRITCNLDNGDAVATPEPWYPPVEVISLDAREAIKAGIASGTPTGPWSPKISNDARSVGTLMKSFGVMTAANQKLLLGELLAAGYVVAPFQKANRTQGQGIRAPDGKPSNVCWLSA